MQQLLQGERFTVVSHGIAAGYAGWLLRTLGAEVDHATALDPIGVGIFLGQGVQFAAEPELPAQITCTLITDAPVNETNRARLANLAESAQVVWLTPWGLTGAWSERPWSDLTLHAAGGWMSAVGEADREPLGPPGAQGQFVAGLYATIAALAPRLGDLTFPGPAGLTDIATAECVAATMIYEPVSFQYHGRIRGRAGHRYSAAQPTLTILPCRDGYLGIQVALHWQWLRFCELIGRPELGSDPRFLGLARVENADELDGIIVGWLADKGRWEAYHLLQRAGIPASATPTLQEVLDSPQLKARDVWTRITSPEGETIEVPGSPLRVTADAPADPPSPRADGPWAPGKLRVVDISMGWAGPLVGHLLACLGADVIKVESHRRFDWWRGSRPPGDDFSLALHERSHVFNSVNAGKRGITIDLASEAGHSLARELIDGADLVIENFRAGVMERLGLDFAHLAESNPGVVMVRQPAFGSTGPESDYYAFGNTMESMSGLTAMLGYEDGPPLMMSNAFGDPVSGLTGTVGALAGLVARRHDNRGRSVEAAQLEGMLPLVSEALVAYQLTGEQPLRRGNAREGAAALLRCAGDDAWVAVEARQGWEALAAALGSTAGDGRAAVAAWTAAQPRDAAVAGLLAAGAVAAPVNSEADILSWEPFSERALFHTEDRTVVGTHLYVSVPVLCGEERALPGGPAPTLGQHNDGIFTAMGLDAAAIETLRSEGVIGEWPA